VTTSVRPFARTPGREISKDRSAPFDIAGFYYDQRFRIADDAPLLRQLIAAVDCPNDLGSPQWAQWYSVALGFEPDLILELGRGYGNSTAVFAQAAQHLGRKSWIKRTKVVSLCVTSEWASLVAPRIARVVDKGWFANVDARRMDILSVDYADILADHERVLVLWDAHGFEIAELVLGDILPRLTDRDHFVLMHDISDNRYPGVRRSYSGEPLWKGSRWQKQTGTWDSRVNIGWMNSQQDQVIALADFSARNDLEIGSADHEYARFFEEHPARADEMVQLLGKEFFSITAHWAFLSLVGKAGPFHFPALSGGRAAVHRSDLVTDAFRHLPATIVTDDKAWAYASTIAWRPAEEPPPHVPSWIRCRLRVDRGVIGVSLLSPNEEKFVESQVVSSTPGPMTVLLAAPGPAERGRLVVHTWDAPVSARVRIDELALVW
jgi:hypothetical protein